MYLGFTLIEILFWCQYLQKIMSASKTLFAFNMSVFIILLITTPNLFSLQHAYSQIESSPNISTDNSGNSNATSRTLDASASNISGTASEDFRSLREQYLSSWERLSFSSSFDTFLADCFLGVQSYGAYQLRASNIFGTDESICLYVEPIGFGYEEFIDQQGNPLYRYNITADVTVSDRQGSPLGSFSVSFEPENSYRKVTELFLVVEIQPSTLTIPTPGTAPTPEVPQQQEGGVNQSGGANPPSGPTEPFQDLFGGNQSGSGGGGGGPLSGLFGGTTPGASQFPAGEYTATYHFTDGVTGESFDVVKDFRIGEIAEVR